MKWIIEQKGEKFLVANDTTHEVRGVHKTRGEAELHAQELQKKHDSGVEMVSARITPPKEIEAF